MKLRAPLSSYQLVVLRWVAAGCPPGEMAGEGHKNSAKALHHRKLIRVYRKHGRWHASVTEDGTYYLEHGGYRPPTSSAGRPAEVERSHDLVAVSAPKPPAKPPKKAAGYTGKTEELIEQVIAAGGRLHVHRDDRRNIAGLVTYANRRNKVPTGMRMVQGWAGGGYDVRLEPLPDWVTAELAPILVPDQIRRPHKVIATLKAKDSALGIKGLARSRALRLLHALVHEAVARGYSIEDNMPKDRNGFHIRGATKGQLTITAHGHAVGVHIKQVEVRVPHVPTASELRRQQTDRWFRMPEWDRTPSERLVLTLDAMHQTRQGSWSDGVTTCLDDVLAEVLQEVELRCAAAVEAGVERERQRAEKQVRWEKAMRVAEADYVQHTYATLVRQQAAQWHEAQGVAAYVEGMRARIADLPEAEAHEAEKWLLVVENHGRRLDPLNGPLAFPDVPKPSGTDLQPYLHGWNPWGPT